MILVAGVALALLVLALAGTGQSWTNEQIVKRLAAERDPRVVAAAAQVLEGRGMKLTAEALRTRARDLSSGATSAGEPVAAPRASVPLVSTAGWRRFARALRTAPLAARSVSGRLGQFAIHLRQLEDIGYVRRVRRTGTGRVAADWVEPLTEATFLSDPQLQYRALVASMARLSEAIVLRKVSAAIGHPIDGRPASLSGLLAVAHRLGIAGLESWLASRGERTRQRIATAAFQRANGIF